MKVREGTRAWLIVAIAVLSLNLRLATSAIAPLLPTIQHDTGLSAAAGGLLVTIPLLCFGALAPLAPRLARRFGAERVIALALVVLIASMLLRSAPGITALFCGTLLLGAAVTCGNVLLPGVIKRDFKHRTGPVLALYSTGITVGASLGVGLTVPLMHLTGWSWREVLGFWALGAGAALLLWLPQMSGARVREAGSAVPTYAGARQFYRDPLAWQVTAFFGFESLVYNATATWLPSLFVAHGISQSSAGLLLAAVNLTGMVTTFAVPVLATRRPTQGSLVVATTALLGASLVGLLLAPVGGALVWMVLFGLGQGAALGLALSLILLRSTNAGHATELSSMAQTFGYLLSALGPVGIGVVHDLAGGWTWPLVVLLVLLVPMLVAGLGASRNRYVLPNAGLVANADKAAGLDVR
jgi:CP family cyanate transporter-like MFS transporter